MQKRLNWTPIYKNIVNNTLDKLHFIIVPFIQCNTLEWLLANKQVSNELQIITRWNVSDILSGVSDIEVYNITKNKKIALYINRDIHLKLYIYRNNYTFLTSGNLTNSGIGLKTNSNIEVGNFVKLDIGDWLEINKILSNSIKINDEIYELFKEFKIKNENIDFTKEENFEFDIFEKISKINSKTKELDDKFSILSLPSISTPDKFLMLLKYKKFENFEEERKFCHDLFLYFNSEDINNLKNNFKNNKTIIQIVNFIKKNKSCSFGRLTAYLHNHLNDQPLPYRQDVKKSVKILFNWLIYYFDEISCRIPGKRSEVLFWNE